MRPRRCRTPGSAAPHRETRSCPRPGGRVYPALRSLLGQPAPRRGRGDSVGWLCRREETARGERAVPHGDPGSPRGRCTFRQEVGPMANRTIKRDKLSHTTKGSLLASANGDGQAKQGKIPKKTYERE